MQSVANQFQINIFIQEPRTDKPDLPVFQRCHLIAEMSQITHPVLIRAGKLRAGRGAVHAGRNDPVLQQFRGKRDRAGHLHRIRDLADRENPVQPLHLFNIGIAQIRRILRSETVRIDEDSFQMNAGKFCSAVFRFHIIRRALKCAGKGLLALCGRARQQSRDPFRQFIFRDRANRLAGTVRKILSAATMRMNINKSRSDGGSSSPQR